MTESDPTASRRALVTGARGFVGPHLVAHLREMGDRVDAVDRTNGPDLADPDGWRELFEDRRPEIVYHLAGWADVGASWDHPAEAFAVNATGVLHLLEAAVAAGVRRVLVVSSADVYGVVGADDLPLRESSPVAPRSPYGASKEAAEGVARRYARVGPVETVVARPFNHIGPGQGENFAVSAFAHRIARAELEGSGEIRHGDLSARRDLTDVRDVVRAYRLLATGGRSGHTYNVCRGEAVAMSDVLDALVALATVPVTTRIDPALLRPVELPVLCGAADPLRSELGWEPTIPLSETLADVLSEARTRVADESTTAPTDHPRSTS